MAVRYNPDARDADLDRIVQEGTPFARPARPRIEMANPANPDKLTYKRVPGYAEAVQRYEVRDGDTYLGYVERSRSVANRYSTRGARTRWHARSASGIDAYGDGFTSRQLAANWLVHVRDSAGTERIEMAEPKPRVPRAGKKPWTEEEALAFANEAWVVTVEASDGSGTFQTHIWGVTDIADAEGEPPEWFAEVGMRFRPTGSDEWQGTGGDIERAVTPSTGGVYHAWLILPEEFRHKGFATAFGDQEDKAYRAAGFKRIRLTAGGVDGPYVWALEGYQFDDAKAKPGRDGAGRDEVSGALEEILLGDWGGLTPEARAEGTDLLTRVRAGYKATPYEFAMLGKDHVAPGFEHLGRHLMGLGVNWFGVREL